MSTSEVLPGICRNCGAFCPVLVTVVDGRPVKVIGDHSTIFEGYTCPKGRAMPEQHNDPNRLLTSLRRRADGEFEPIGSLQAADEIAARLQRIIERYGPRSVALYTGGGMIGQYCGSVMAACFLRAIESPMSFSASSIDKPGEKISMALHGNWNAGAQTFASADTWMIVGANPVIAKSNGAPYHNPGTRLKEAVNRGMKLIVIDPRRTETARRAHTHLQVRPGEDPSVLAGIIHIIIAENLYDSAFVSENAVGFEELKAAVAPFMPDYVAQRAGIAVDSLLQAARTFGQAKRGGVICSTGPSFSTHGNLTFYLGLCLNTLCGRWTRAGDLAANANVLLPAFTPRAQPQKPYPVFGKHEMRVKGLRESASGMPTAALADEMLLEGEGQVKALICLGGNPMSSWPDERKTEAGLGKLELMVLVDVVMSATARHANYVIATPMSLEVPSTTYLTEYLKYLGVSRGWEIPWAQYVPAVSKHPAGSDLIEEHAFFFRMAQKMGLQLNWVNYHGFGKFEEESPSKVSPLDMTRVPTLDELWELTTCDSRVPLEEVKRFPHGHVFDIPVTVEPRAADCADMLQIGDPMMMADLAAVRAEDYERAHGDKEFPYRLVSRRANHVMNSLLVGLPIAMRKRAYNPAFMHPDDLADLGLSSGDVVTVRSRRDTVLAIVEGDETLRRGIISMTHGFGGRGREAERDPYTGTNVNLLIPQDEFDPISGIPRMSTIPVTIERKVTELSV